jgi:hypothetical protein
MSYLRFVVLGDRLPHLDSQETSLWPLSAEIRQ